MNAIRLHQPGRPPVACFIPYKGARFVVVGTTKCQGCQRDCPPLLGCAVLACPMVPACHACGSKPFRVRCDESRESEDDRHLEGEARCIACGAVVGLLRVNVDTLFGLREDRAVQVEIERAGGRVYV